ncbi:MAG: hypothetical protein JRE28_13615 [Deltaproteobacteria bacterium]|nr:hypothetical protein [Deltaproteobacteria bacterium]
MAEKYMRKLQRHGTGSEIHVPPEVCERLGVKKSDTIEFDLVSGNNEVTLRKAGGSPAGSRTNSRPGGSPAASRTSSGPGGSPAGSRTSSGPGGSPAESKDNVRSYLGGLVTVTTTEDDDSDDSGIGASISFEDY